jgi:hypothetical protein
MSWLGYNLLMVSDPFFSKSWLSYDLLMVSDPFFSLFFTFFSFQRIGPGCLRR